MYTIIIFVLGHIPTTNKISTQIKRHTLQIHVHKTHIDKHTDIHTCVWGAQRACAL